MNEETQHTSRVVVALPADDEPIHAFGEEDKHLTLLYLGKPEENPDLDMNQVRQAVEAYVAETPPFIATIEKSGTLGDEGATVSFLIRDDVPHRDAMLANPLLSDAIDAIEQFPEYIPHVTLGYDMAEDDVPTPTGTVLFDRIAVWDGENRTEYPLQRITALPVTDVFTLKRSITLANQLPAGGVRDAARRFLSRRAKDLGCRHAIPTQWIRDRANSAAFRAAVVEKFGSTQWGRDGGSRHANTAEIFAIKAAASGLSDDILRTAYMRAVRDFAMTPLTRRPPISRDQFAQARVNSLIRLAAGDLSARTDDQDLIARMKESS